MYLVDTNYLSETRKIGRADANVAAWSRANPLEMMFVSVITLLEIETALMRLARCNPAQASRLEFWLNGVVLPRVAGRILPVDLACARRAAALHVPNPRPIHDALIAATALVHGLTVVTRNTVDFEPMGVHVLNPWRGPART